MAYLIESVFMMLALAAKTQDRRINIFYKQFEKSSNLNQIHRNKLKEFNEHQMKKPLRSEVLRVAFRLKPDSFIEINCTAKN